jgi:hypothetical protein
MDAGSELCGQHLRVLQRGASNVYFPQVVSSLYLPLWGERTSREIINVLDQAHVWALLSQGIASGKIDAARCETVAAMCGVDARELLEAAQRKLEGAQAVNVAGGGEDDFRRSEYAAICEARGGAGTELYVESMPMQSYASDVRRLISRVQLVHKLRETRALAGFTRILPPDGSLASNRLQGIRLDPQMDWLPAIKVYGEGIFVELNSAELASWLEKHAAIGRRIALLANRYNTVRTVRGQPQRTITSKFVLIHTLAHILINQLSYESGYGSASLRERLYCETEREGTDMNGFLIYTASGDSEGSMGGLVRQGLPSRLELTLRNALHRASWCSSDPVCIESPGQGTDSANLAACHGCSLLPETSCEEGNRLLDRALLVGTPDDRAMGYFSALAV